MRYLTFFLFSWLTSNAFDPDALHPFTDVTGRTLEAKFISVDDAKVTIEWKGERIELPLNFLNAESKALTGLLGRMQPKPKEISGDLRSWTDVQGRTIEAKFLTIEGQNLMLEWNGRVTSLPLTMFDEASRKLANDLEQSKSKSEPKPSQASPVKVDLDGPLNLENEYPWQNNSGQTVKGVFLSMDNKQLIISIARGTREVPITLDSLSEDSRKLAQKLNGLAVAKKKDLADLVAKRKKMKVPQLSVTDLDKEHELSDIQGQSLVARFTEANNEKVSLLVKGRSQPIDLPWTRFSDESIALLEGLRRIQEKQASQKPKIIAAKGNRLSYFATGKYKNYNTILETENYLVGVPSSGSSIHIFVKKNKEGTQNSSELGTRRVGLGFATLYTDKTDPKRHRNKRRVIKSFNTSPSPSEDGGLLALSGTFTNGGTFEYNMDIKEGGFTMWSKIKDPSGEKWPSRHQINIGVSGVVPNAINLSMAEINAAVGNGVFDFQPVTGKGSRVPMNMKWTDVRKKMKVNTSNLKSMDLYGKPYDPVRISIGSVNNRDMRLDMDKSYAKTFPLQGVSLDYFPLQERNRKEVPRTKALKVTIRSN